MALGFTLPLTHTFADFLCLLTSRKLKKIRRDDTIPILQLKKLRFLKVMLFVQANKLWHLQLSWILSEVVLFFPQVETQQQDGVSGWKALEFTAPIPSHGLA